MYDLNIINNNKIGNKLKPSANRHSGMHRPNSRLNSYPGNRHIVLVSHMYILDHHLDIVHNPGGIRHGQGRVGSIVSLVADLQQRK